MAVLITQVLYFTATGEDSNTQGDEVAEAFTSSQTGGLATTRASSSSANQSVVYTYDELGQLVEVQYPNGVTISYSYDPVGNRKSANVTSELITLHTGWNLISFSVNNCYYDTPSPPIVPMLDDVNYVPVASIGVVFSSIEGKYERVRSFDEDGGHTWDPALPMFSDMHYVACGYGYWIKMTEPGVLTLEGTAASPTATMSLHAGWNLVGCWSGPTCSYDSASEPTVAFPPYVTNFNYLLDIGEAFDSIDGLYDRVRSFDEDGGHTYDPALPMFSDLHYVGPGYGYWIKMNATGNLSYSQN